MQSFISVLFIISVCSRGRLCHIELDILDWHDYLTNSSVQALRVHVTCSHGFRVQQIPSGKTDSAICPSYSSFRWRIPFWVHRICQVVLTLSGSLKVFHESIDWVRSIFLFIFVFAPLILILGVIDRFWSECEFFWSSTSNYSSIFLEYVSG